MQFAVILYRVIQKLLFIKYSQPKNDKPIALCLKQNRGTLRFKNIIHLNAAMLLLRAYVIKGLYLDFFKDVPYILPAQVAVNL